MIRWLITGGAGFIGSHVAEALVARGDQVRVLDDLSTGDRSNLKGVAVEFIHGSVTDSVVVATAMDGCDQVIHLAAAVGVRRILAQPVSSINTNVDGTRIILEACARLALPILIASSSEVYGDSDAVSFREDHHLIIGPSTIHRWSYACSKLLDEFLALAYHHEHHLPVRVVRFFNVTGPRQSPSYGMVLPGFAAAALRGSPLTVHGDGGQSRCFLHVADCVAAVLAVLDCPAAIGQVINIGSDEETTILALAQRMVQMSASASAVTLISYAEAFPEGGFADMRRRVPDVAKLHRLTAWRRTRNLDQTIRDALNWARQ